MESLLLKFTDKKITTKMEESIREKLEKLKKFRKELNLETTSQFDELLESIKKDLPDSYLSKLNVLKIYEYYLEPSVKDDLPF